MILFVRLFMRIFSSIFSNFKSIILATVLALTISINSHAQDEGYSDIYFSGYGSYSLYTGRGFVSGQANIDKIVNSNPYYSTEPLQVMIWLSRKAYVLGDPNAKVISIASKNVGSIYEYDYLQNVLISTGGRRKVGGGSYFVTLALMDQSRTVVYDSLTFKKKLRISN